MLNYIKNLKIRSKLLLLIAIVFAGFTVSQLSSLWVIHKYKIGGSTYERLTAFRKNIRDVALLNADLNEARVKIGMLINESDKREMEKYRDDISKLNSSLENRFKELIEIKLILPEVEAPIREAQRAYLEFRDTRDLELIPAVFEGKRDKARELLYGIQTKRYEVFHNESEKAVKILGEKIPQFEMEVRTSVNKNITASFIFSGFLFLLILALGFGIVRWITNPLGLINTVSQKMVEGNLKQEKIDVYSKDEMGILANVFNRLIDQLSTFVEQAEKIAKGDLREKVQLKGDLADAFNKMVDGMRDLARNALTNADQVAATSQQVSSSSQQMNASTQEVSATVQQISKGSEIQAQKVEETSKVMGQMKQSVENVAASATQASESATQSKDIALRGGKEAKKAVEKIEKIYDVVASSASVIEKLGERSSQIGEIVTVITDIADQTNLLALNAAIEAARAGEAGRGFAVVAEEVRKLAESSSKQADEINKLVKVIQSETGSAVSSMQEGKREVTEGKEVIINAGKALDEIISAASEVATQVTKITEFAQEQSAGVKQVAKAVEDIAASAEEAASATEETSSSTEEMTASMQELATSAQSLADMSMALKNVVSRFQIGDEERAAHVVSFAPVARKFTKHVQKKRA